MNPENRWVKKTETIPWEAIEEKYATLFPSKKGMPAKIPFVPSLLVEFRKRLTAEVLEEINEMIIAYNAPDDPPPTGGGDDNKESETNSGTVI